MRLGGPIFEPFQGPFEWAAACRRASYRATYPPANNWPAQEVTAAVAEHGLVVAEIGAWSNPISPNPVVRQEAIALCIAMLARADELGACCCVNIVEIG